MTHSQAEAEINNFRMHKKGSIESSINELLNFVSKDVIDIETDKVYKSLLCDDDPSSEDLHIVPSKIVQRQPNCSKEVSTDDSSNLDVLGCSDLDIELSSDLQETSNNAYTIDSTPSSTHMTFNIDSSEDSSDSITETDSNQNTPDRSTLNHFFSFDSKSQPEHPLMNQKYLHPSQSHFKRYKRKPRNSTPASSLPPSVGSNPRESMISQGLKWYKDSISRSFIKLPKLTRDNRKLISPGLKELFKDEIIPLIDKYAPYNWTDIDEDTRWHIFEGAFEESMHRIRVHIANKLDIDPKWIYPKTFKKSWINKDQRSLANLQFNVRNLNKLTADVERLNDEEDDIPFSELQQIQNRVTNCLSFIPEETRSNIFGTTDIHQILNLLSNVDSKAKEFGQWLELKIKELTKEEMSIKSKRILQSRLRECYSDNAKKTLNNFILSKESPECNIDEEKLHDFFANSFRKEEIDFVPDMDGIFALHNCFSEESQKAFLEHISNKTLISDVIKSRKFESAAGPDGIDYSIFKLVPDEAADFIVNLSKICIDQGKVPYNWKKSIMRLIYKKDDPMQPCNWRPISISNALYRIISCSWARAINLMNTNLHIFSKPTWIHCRHQRMR